MKTTEVVKEPQKRSKSRGWKWWTVIAIAVLAFAGAAAWGAFRYYPRWNQERLIKRARAFIEWKDYNAAGLTVQRVLQLNNRNIAAARLMAEMADTAKAPQGLVWRRRLVELEPERLENHLDFAERLLAVNKPEIARTTLAAVAERGASSGRYHDLLGQLAVLSNDKEKAESAFATALKLEPKNPAFEFNQVVLRLRDEDAPVAEQARTALDGFLSQPAFFRRASHALIGDALQRKDISRAISLADELRKHPEAAFEDRLQYLELLHAFKRREYTAYLTQMQDEATGDTQKLHALIRWLNGNNGSLLAIEWSKRLPSKAVTTMPVPVALAQSYANLGDWAGLKPLIQSDSLSDTTTSPVASPSPKIEGTESSRNWKDYEFMRLALLARAKNQQGETQESKNQWNAAVRAAENRPESLSVLARIAISWGWESESQEALWAVARSSTDSRWALDILLRRYVSTGATRSLYQVASRICEISPSDLSVKNNLACFCLLLEGTTQQGIKLSEELYLHDPQNPAFASTHAYALHLQGRTSEGIKLMKSLGEETLKKPEYAAYYGILLAAAGEREEARRSLILGSKAPLLREERALVEEALAKLDRR